MHDYKSEVDTRLVLPKMSKVVMLNDDYTTQDFVVSVLKDVFDKNTSEATNIMLEIHNNGRGICGIYTYDIAQTKANIAIQKSRQAGFPLRIIVEEE
ncbi:ATP-dependent Clp protease adaptor ClpS [Helicobacter sp. MIT 99-5507]|uniref:ATP-dependent Clp protease adaptor ClpS n=1 Tax=Helicobacter sp. MIT 99-5507 TaxID=152489 RepID=UPI000E1EDA4A|nr:ATP-dependent Clp protease adaptor ClpS [Helicobacter sp. MIT 99-5507]RDU57900.1 ATP-dependent Clp protease adaptor ClpS [Helicobacter sp. MIT 99-5507]